MRIVKLALLLLCINFAVSIIDAAGIFRAGYAPAGMSDVKAQMTPAYDAAKNPPQAPGLIELVSTIVWGAAKVAGIIWGAPTAFAALIGQAVPIGVTTSGIAVRALFVEGARVVMWCVYIIALAEIIASKYLLED